MSQPVPYGKIVIGAVAPVMIFYFFNKAGQPLNGAICACLWSIMVAAFWLVKEKTWDAFSSFGGIYAVAELATVLLTNNPDWYLFSPVVFGAVFGVAFLGSVLLRKPFVRYFAEQAVGVDAFPRHIRSSRHYLVVWNRVTLVWAATYLVKSIVLAMLLLSSTVEAYLAVRGVFGWPVSAALLAFSFWYPRFYWSREPELA